MREKICYGCVNSIVSAIRLRLFVCVFVLFLVLVAVVVHVSMTIWGLKRFIAQPTYLLFFLILIV